MKNIIRNIRFAIILIALFSGCTTSRWIPSGELKQDPTQIRVLETSSKLVLTGNPTPNEPIIYLNIINDRLIEAPLQYESIRVIQRYRPRWGILASGTITAAGLIYLSEISSVSSTLTTSHKNIMRIAAAALITGAVFQLKPVGDPIPTGESIQLGRAEVRQYRDTTQLSLNPVRVRINAAYNGEALVTGLEKVVTGSLGLNIVEELGIRSLIPVQDDYIDIQFVTEHDVIDHQVKISAVMNQYVRILQSGTPLRSSPSTQFPNVITNAAASSLLPLSQTTETGWYRVMLGATPAFVRSNEGELVWRTGSGSGSDMILSTTGSTFGTVDVERNIPEIGIIDSSSAAIIITFEGYPTGIRSLSNSSRSGNLVYEYVVSSLGIPAKNTARLQFDASSTNISQQISSEINQIRANIPESELNRLFVYLNGASGIHSIFGEPTPHILFPHSNEDASRYLTYADFFEQIMSLAPKSITMVLDTDFSNRDLELNNQIVRNIVRDQFSNAIFSIPNYLVVLASDVDQFAGNYQSNDLRTDRVHGILSYYFMQGIQQGIATSSELQNYLQRNMTFTSRRLHNRAQDPIIWSRNSFRLLPPQI